MNNRVIPKKALQRAIDNGWDGSHYFVMGNRAKELKDYEIWNHYSKNDIIFNRDFAKALWGEGAFANPSGDSSTQVAITGWHHHLMQMVVSEDPIEYLKENL